MTTNVAETAADQALVTYERTGPIAAVTVNRPGNLTAISDTLGAALGAHFQSAIHQGVTR